jgi:hypothetical protein
VAEMCCRPRHSRSGALLEAKAIPPRSSVPGRSRPADPLGETPFVNPSGGIRLEDLPWRTALRGLTPFGNTWQTVTGAPAGGHQLGYYTWVSHCGTPLRVPTCGNPLMGLPLGNTHMGDPLVGPHLQYRFPGPTLWNSNSGTN